MLILEHELVEKSHLSADFFYGLLSIIKIPITIGMGKEEVLSSFKSIDFDYVLDDESSTDQIVKELAVYCEACKIIQESKDRIKQFTDFNFNSEQLHEKIQEELQNKNRRISSLYMQILEYKNRLKRSYQEWEALGFSLSNDKVRRFHSSLKQYAKDVDNDWDLFSEHFVEVHPSFFNDLKNLASNLSNENLKMCAYIKIGMNNHEIANYMNILVSSVKRSQVRIKGKLKLPKQTSLRKYINTVYS